jgi:NAD(P)-dependent dehydrogenase (short-subunit alcohol dehydrogenase family)
LGTESLAERLHAVVIGASSGVGRAIAEQLSAGGASLVIASRNLENLDDLAAHLELTNHTAVSPLMYDLTSGITGAADFCSTSVKTLGRVDAVFLTAAAVSDADSGLTPGPTAHDLMEVDLMGPIHVLTEFARVLEEQKEGALVVFSSIAAPVPRRNNMVYSSAKIGLEGFCRGLRHYMSGCGVRVQTYRLGFVDTPMAVGRTRLFPKAKPDAVANHVIARLGKDFGLAYCPRYWRLVVFVLRHLPWPLFRRLDF